jgi:GT2 family glycosyltransferase
MANLPSVSIAIVYKKENPYIIQCLGYCSKLNYPNFKVQLYPDFAENAQFMARLKDYRFKTYVVPTGKLNIPQKRNIGVRNCDSELIAFIDDDAYPRHDWLQNAVPFFSDQSISAVGGPNLTPADDSYIQRIAGNVMKSKLGFGAGYVRHTPVSQRFMTELPTCNLIVRKSVFDTIQFDETLITGEDAKLCYDIVNSGQKILYSPTVVVFHHRRKLLFPFIKQFFNYGIYKGKQIRAKEVHNLYYLVPAAFFLFVIFGGVSSVVFSSLRYLYASLLALYFIIMLFEAIQNSKPLEMPVTWLCLFIGHMSYGCGLVLGYFTK